MDIGDEFSFLVRGIGRVAKNQLVERCSNPKTGKLNTPQFEGELLSACVLDPETQESLLPPDEWEVPADVSGPLVDACMRVCGFSKAEQEELKNSNATEN